MSTDLVKKIEYIFSVIDKKAPRKKIQAVNPEPIKEPEPPSKYKRMSPSAIFAYKAVPALKAAGWEYVQGDSPLQDGRWIDPETDYSYTLRSAYQLLQKGGRNNGGLCFQKTGI